MPLMVGIAVVVVLAIIGIVFFAMHHSGGNAATPAMIDTRIVPKDLQNKVADQVRKGQENMNGTVKAWKEAAQSMRPQLPELSQSLPAKLPGREMLIANAHDLAEQLRIAQRRFAGQVRDAAEPWAKQVHQVRKAAAPLAEQMRHASDPWVKQMHEYRKAVAPLAEQMRHASDPWVKQMHDVRKAAAPLTEQVRKAAAPLTDPWAKQMHHARKAAAPLTEQARKAAAPLTEQARKAAAPLNGAHTAKPAAKTAPAAETSTTKSGAARKPRAAKK
jgi:gas vesicle protein